MPIVIEYTSSGLSVRHTAAHIHISELKIDNWAPRHGWRFGLGARVGAESDDHHVDDLLLEAGSAVGPQALPLEVTLNGLQFSESDLMFTYLPEAEEAAAG